MIGDSWGAVGKTLLWLAQNSINLTGLLGRSFLIPDSLECAR